MNAQVFMHYFALVLGWAIVIMPWVFGVWSLFAVIYIALVAARNFKDPDGEA